MRRNFLIVSALIATLTIGILAYLLISDMYNGEAKEAEMPGGKISSGVQGKITEEQLQRYKEEGLNPFGQDLDLNELNAALYNDYIHGMSHQKVRAEKKWGFYEIHPERIKWLLEGLDVVNVGNESTYRNILQRWEEGDFSKIDKEHNAIWSIQNGTVGKATGILSLEEEQKYIDSQ
ncbi:DUF6241 domain-containing protein [Oceanobacillus chungangensis]|uniref:CTP synthase n=1 Tax=Oceanobacillus chungangensis TaxID=1229152 RepID=A0A3D8PIC5_9BACI|nr:DUF6241 domain-containing protein [Oceanobacillus chungangensis]RDW14991.1 hypothetical protein CWR45_19225 [Oceanobacillus chungangensis]